MTGQSECACSCGNSFDPTLCFQKSTCCNAGLVRRTFHYACTKCHKVVPSRFLFDENLFDKAYFREMMQESRRKAKKRREEIRKLLAESRSEALPLVEEPLLESIPGLSQDRDGFIQEDGAKTPGFVFDTNRDFRMDDYRERVVSVLGWDTMLFSNITPLVDDHRRDRIWRFITLVFMQHDHEVELTQYDRDLMVQRICNEAYS